MSKQFHKDGQRVASPDNTIQEAANFDTLFERIEAAEAHDDYLERIEAWSFILNDHIRWGNRKIADHVAIFNINSASDCPNRWTDNCQVDGDDCYAVKAEKAWPHPEDFRQRQEYIWDCLDWETWARAFLAIIERKRKFEPEDVDLRLSQAGDFRYQGDVIKAQGIAEILSNYGIQVYTYSASDYLDWTMAEDVTVNQSNTIREYGDRVYTALPAEIEPEDTDRIGDDAVLCPYEASDGEILCGECRICINPEGPDAYITLH